MDVVGRWVATFLSVVGGCYAAWLLLNCWRGWPAAAPASRMARRAKQFERLLEAGGAVAVLLVAGGLLAHNARQFRDACDRRTEFSLGAAYEVAALLNVPPSRVRRNVSRPERPIYGADLGHLPVTDEDVRVLLRYAPEIEFLNLIDTKITDACLADLKQARALKDLCLGYTAVTDAGLEQLSQIEDLETLSLSSTKITDEGLLHLRGLSKLRELDLSSTSISDAGLESLRHLPSLHYCFAHQSKVTEHGLAEFMESVSKEDDMAVRLSRRTVPGCRGMLE